MISIRDANTAVARLAVLTYYPQEPVARAEIARMLLKMVNTTEQLEWLVQTFVNHIGTWPGAKELRGVFCTQFKPADGIEESSTLAGFTALDSESGYLEAISNSRRAELEAPRGQSEAAKTLLKRLN